MLEKIIPNVRYENYKPVAKNIVREIFNKYENRMV